jgi:hypothetical protein
MDNVHDPYRSTVLALLREAIVRLDARETAHRQRYPKTTPNIAAPRVIERRVAGDREPSAIAARAETRDSG